MTNKELALVTSIDRQSILVLGGGGFIGRHVVRRLLDAGAEVRVLDQGSVRDLDPRVELITGTVTDATLLSSSVSGCDVVIYLAANSLPGSGNHALSAEVRDHVGVTLQAAEISQAAGVRRFIFAGSGGTAYGYGGEEALREDMPTAPINAYGVSKLAIEHYLRLISRAGTMRTTTLRISNPYGEGQRARRGQGVIAAAMEHALSGRPMPVWGDGTVARDFLYVADVAEAFAAACTVEDPPELVNIGSGEAVSLLEVIKQIGVALGREVPVEFQPSRTVDVATNRLNISRAYETLGWAPRVSLSDGLSRTAKWWLNGAV